jgi:hypothetical protein
MAGTLLGTLKGEAMEWEQIFKVGAEGGMLAVMGRKGSTGEWSFLMVRDESTLREFVDDLTEDEVYSQCYANTWEGVLAKMDQYQWAQLYPVMPFHEEFQERIWDAVMERGPGEYGLRDWQRCCGKLVSP